MSTVIFINDNGEEKVLREGNVNELDVLFRQDYFAMKLWGREDIKIRIEEVYNREATEEEIDEIIDNSSKWWRWDVLNEATDGEWDCIDDEIYSILGEPEEEED